MRSPCNRDCRLNDDDLCLGCFRLLDEIYDWKSYSEEEQQNIINECNKRKLVYLKENFRKA